MMDGSTTADERMRKWLKIETAPDVLDTIANLSNDEVFTAPGVANQMLDLLPVEVWSNPDLKFLDPCCKTGVFLREITKRLMAGLVKIIPDDVERREHILRNQVYGIAITELTALMSRRTLYCASDATRLPNPDYPENCFSAVIFDTPEGNIKFPELDHDYDNKGKCRVCGASDGVLTGDDREGRESYAYPFIHMEIQEIFGDMQFDVVIGNPPYQLKDGGHGSSASPIYQLFVDAAKALSPRFLSMIIPARWYAGGKGLDAFRESMISDRKISTLVDIPNASECFPGVEIKGGVCFFVRGEKDRSGCEIWTLRNGYMRASEARALDEFDIIIRDSEAVSILNKVIDKSEFYMDIIVSSRKPFGFPTNFTGIFDSPERAVAPLPPSLSAFDKERVGGAIQIYARGSQGWIGRDRVKVGTEIIDKFKVLTSYAYGAGETIPHQIMGKPIIARPGSCCTETYLVAGVFDSEPEAENFAKYMKTRFFRFTVSLRKNTQHMSKDKFRFVPVMNMMEAWTDDKLYAHFGITDEEVKFIESMIKEMP
jgi:site-specific DNA-methyltransferase (adenine-specific)